MTFKDIFVNKHKNSKAKANANSIDTTTYLKTIKIAPQNKFITALSNKKATCPAQKMKDISKSMFCLKNRINQLVFFHVRIII